MENNITGSAGITINAPASKVWEALTTPEVIKQYFFGTDAVSDWKVGSPLIFKGEWQGKQYQDKGTILESVPQKIFKYDYWSSMSGIEDKPENYVIITYELSEKDNATTLTVSRKISVMKKRKSILNKTGKSFGGSEDSAREDELNGPNLLTLEYIFYIAYPISKAYFINFAFFVNMKICFLEIKASSISAELKIS